MSAASDLTQGSWQTFSRLLDEALELPAGERLTWLEALGPEHAAVKPALRAVLARAGSGVETAHWLATLPSDGAAPPLDESDLRPGATVGPYRLVRELGVGGMGAVWLAERADGTLKRQVALKLPRATWSRGLAERMAREREILAALEHPNIARLYDAGTDAQGRPYLALEYVEGQPIDVYCRERSLPVRGRVGLLLQVAQAVAFAHSRLVVHRDLKPSNVLVTADGQVRLLDFGIAKLMEGEGDRAAETQLTQLAGRALTPDYASPEQIRGEPIGTASDVYSLGVVSYELLTGGKPYKLKRGSAAELEEAIATVDAPPASAMANDTRAKKELKGDLDAILNKALKKGPDQRYATVDAFARDVDRYLAGQRVVARPDSLAYRVSRFAKRYRTPLLAAAVTVAAFGLAIGIGATALVILALLLGLGAALWQANKARRQAEIAREQTRVAQTEAKTAAAVQDFLESIFRANTGDQADPIRARRRTARELLDEGASRIESALNDSPEAKLRVLRTLAALYGEMSEFDRETQMLRAAVSLAERAFPATSEHTARCLSDLAETLAMGARLAEATEVLQRASAIAKSNPDLSDDLRAKIQIAWIQNQCWRADTSALAEAREVVAALAMQGPSEALFNAQFLLGNLESLAGRPELALRHQQAAQATMRRTSSGLKFLEPALNAALARSFAHLGDMHEAERHLLQAVTLSQASTGPDSVLTLLFVLQLAQQHSDNGQPAEALRSLQRALAALPQVGDATKRSQLAVRTAAVQMLTLLRQGRPAQALAALDDLRPHFVEEHDEPRQQCTLLLAQADVLLTLGRALEAAAVLDEADRLTARWNTSGTLLDEVAQARIRHLIVTGQANTANALWQRAFAQAPLSTAGLRALQAEIEEALHGPRAGLALAVRHLVALDGGPAPVNAIYARKRLLITQARSAIALGSDDDALGVLRRALALDEALADPLLSPDRVLLASLCAKAHLALGQAELAMERFSEAQAIRSGHRELGRQYTGLLEELRTELVAGT